MCVRVRRTFINLHCAVYFIFIRPWRNNGRVNKSQESKTELSHQIFFLFLQRRWCAEDFNEAVKWHPPPPHAPLLFSFFLFYSNNSDVYCALSYTQQSYRWGANWCWGMQLCRLPNCQGVKSEKVSLLLIIRSATNSRVRPSPFFPQPSINILAVVQKEKRKNNLRTIITVGWAGCLRMFVCIIMGAEAGLP